MTMIKLVKVSDRANHGKSVRLVWHQPDKREAASHGDKTCDKKVKKSEFDNNKSVMVLWDRRNSGWSVSLNMVCVWVHCDWCIVIHHLYSKTPNCEIVPVVKAPCAENSTEKLERDGNRAVRKKIWQCTETSGKILKKEINVQNYTGDRIEKHRKCKKIATIKGEKNEQAKTNAQNHSNLKVKSTQMLGELWYKVRNCEA